MIMMLLRSDMFCAIAEPTFSGALYTVRQQRVLQIENQYQGMSNLFAMASRCLIDFLKHLFTVCHWAFESDELATEKEFVP